MTDTLLVTSTEEGIGKTAITIALAKAAQEADADVGYMKPKGTRLQSAVGKTRDEDPMLARELLGLDAEMHEMEPIVYSPTFVKEAVRGREDPGELRERVAENFEALSADRDVMLVEGSDELETGGIVDLTDITRVEKMVLNFIGVFPHHNRLSTLQSTGMSIIADTRPVHIGRCIDESAGCRVQSRRVGASGRDLMR